MLPSPQTSLNLGFARQASFGDAIDLLEYQWPPLYPSLLWCGARLGLHAQTTNALLFLVTLGALVPAARLAAPAIHPGLPVTLYALCAFNYWNLQQVVSETLPVPLAIGVLLFSLRSRVADLSGASSYRRDLAALTALAAAACLSRYFAIFWLLPVAAWAAASPQKAHPLLRTGSVLAIAAAPVGVWIIQARVATGFLTGMDRFAPRKSHDHTTLPTNLEMTARTSLMDWFGTSGPASHAALRQVWEPSTLDIWLFSLGLAMMLACGVAAWHASRTGPRAEPGERAAGFLLSYFSFGYIGWVLVLWTAGNNDPINSRFLHVSYVFLLLGGFHVYSRVKMRASSYRDALWLRAPFLLLFVLVVAIQARSTLGALAPVLFGPGVGG